MQIWKFKIIWDKRKVITDNWNVFYKVKCKCTKCNQISEKFTNIIKKQWCKYCKSFSRKVIYKDNYAELELTWWDFTKVPLDILDDIRMYCWYKSIRWSVEARIWTKLIKLHRLILKPNTNLVVDHINWDTLDNRKNNLRICTRLNNSRNINKVCWITSKFKWVYWNRSRQRFIAGINNKWKKITKQFIDEILAAKWYDKKSVEIYWKFAKTNKELNLLI